MNWHNIKISDDGTYFLFNGERIFNNEFIEVLKFHEPGLAPVTDSCGSFHIDASGKELYPERYARTFGFYCNRAAVVKENRWFHLTETGKAAYNQTYHWTGNFQENLCPVRDEHDQYFHIDLHGNRIYRENYVYCGDFKDGIACVKMENGFYRHINKNGDSLNHKSFCDLGVFHKSFATAKDENGWFHIDKKGNELYTHRFLAIEPFYNGFALVTRFDNQKLIINEHGEKIIAI